MQLGLGDYGVVESGTSNTALMLWGSGFSVLEIDVSRGDSWPALSFASSEGGEVLTVDLADPSFISNDKHVWDMSLAYSEVSGWHVHVGNDDSKRYIIQDPLGRYWIQIEEEEHGLIITTSKKASMSVIRQARVQEEDLKSKNIWPVLACPA